MSKLPVEEIEHKEEHPICENCGAEMKEIGKEKAYDELVFTPAKYHIRRHIVYTYKIMTMNPMRMSAAISEISLYASMKGDVSEVIAKAFIKAL